MPNNNYSLRQMYDCAASKVSKAMGTTMVLVGGYNLMLDLVPIDVGGIIINSLVVSVGIGYSFGLEDKLKRRKDSIKEINNKLENELRLTKLT